MSLFGSREDDPLLQGDPLAPASDGDAPEQEEAATGDMAPTGGERPPDPEEDRMLVYSRDEATEGAFAELNRALREGWRLTRVQLQEDGSLAFHLERKSDTDVI